MKTLFFFITLSLFTCTGLYAQPNGNYITMTDQDDMITVPHSSYWNLSGDFTISLKVNFAYVSGDWYQMLMTHPYGGFEFAIRNYNLYMSSNGSGYAFVAPWVPQPDTWYHLVVTRTGSTIQAYVDGQLLGTGAATIGVVDAPLKIGCYSSPGYVVGGGMDDVSVWNVGVTQSYISSVLAYPLTGNEPGLVGYWDMNETGTGPGIVVANKAILTGNTLNGITEGTSTTPYFTEVPPPVHYCLQFDGNDDLVNMGQVMNPVFAGADKKFTIEALIYLNASDTYQWIVLKYDAWDYRQFGWRVCNGYLQFFYYCGLTGSGASRIMTGSTLLVPGQWYHVAITYDGSIDSNNGFDRVKLYVNGQPDPFSATGGQYSLGNIVNGGAPLCIGGGTYKLLPQLNNGYTFDGIIKNVRVWDYIRPIIDLQNYMYNPIPDPASQTNLKLYVTLSEGNGGTVTDISSSGLTGSLGMNASASIYDPVWTTCTPPAVQVPVPNCLDFDGIDDYVNVGNKAAFDMNFTMTIEAWIYPEGPGSGGSAGSGGAIVNKEGEFEIARFSNGYIGWAFANYNPGWTWVQTTAYAPQNQWSHVAVVYDNSEVRTYLNGILQHTYPVSGILGDVAPTYNDLWITGRQSAPGEQLFDGKMDEVRIWSTARSESEIRAEMHREIPSPATVPGLVANYSFNQGAGTTAYDYSINLYNGTLTNMDPSGDWETSTAPIPYNTIANGSWENNSTWNAGQNAPVSSWARTAIKHNVSLSTSQEIIDLAINSNGKLTVNPAGHLTVTGDLNNEKGIAGLLLKSDATGTGTVIENDGAPASVERFFSGTDADWHMVSSPVNNALSGVFTGKYLQRFDEASNQYIEITPVNVPLVPMEGYAAYGTSAINKVTFTGNLNSGSQSIPVTNSATAPYGWNLTGNPFASAVDWNLVIPTLSGIGSTIYYLEAATGNWLTWNGAIGSGSQYIPPMQGFFVSAGTNSTLSIPQEARTHAGSAGFYKQDVSNLLVIKATGNNLEDKTYMQFNEAATAGFDLAYDGYKIISDVNPLLPQLYTTAGGRNLSINVQPVTPEIPLSFSAGTDGTYIISIDEFTAAAGVILEDRITGTFNNLLPAGYPFTYAVTDDPNRFILHLSPLGIDETSGQQVKIVASKGMLKVISALTSVGTVSVYDVVGRLVFSGKVVPGQLNAFPLEVSKGCYLVKVASSAGSLSRKVYME